MSKYTTEVRFICENYAGLDASVGYNDVDKILNKTWDKIFDFDFPIFDNDYRSVLCIKILKHYYTREIGFETVGLWKLKLNMMMNEIMPYYNKLYESEFHIVYFLGNYNIYVVFSKLQKSQLMEVSSANDSRNGDFFILIHSTHVCCIFMRTTATSFFFLFGY